jgi:hypothetical protein
VPDRERLNVSCAVFARGINALVECCVRPFVLQRLAGHANIGMTARHSHPEQMDRAIGVMD